MPRQNVKLISEVYDVLKRKDQATLAALSRVDIQVHQSEELPWGGAYEGLDQAMAFFGRVTSYIDSAVSVEGILDAGDHVVVIGHSAGTVKATGKTFSVPLVHVWKLQEGKIASLAVFLDNISILPALAPEKQLAELLN
ncbi:MAG: nuclear transport factor 2 family protein [Acidobacteriaceae bacterium]|nr:nuclear transport factor 2 family protein [Acidobacteriaceae bacterium]